MNPKAYASAINSLQTESAHLDNVPLALGPGANDVERWLREEIEISRARIAKALKEAGQHAYGDRYEYGLLEFRRAA